VWLLLSRRFLLFYGRADDDIRSLGTGDCPADDDDAVFRADLQNAQVLKGHSLVTHVAGHAHVFPDTSGSRSISDGTISTMHCRTVGHWLSGEIVALDRALEAFALGLSDHVDILAGLEDRDIQVCGLRSRFTVSESKLANESLGRRRRFGEVPGLGFSDALGLLVVESDLDRSVAVLVFRFGLENAIPAGFDNRGGCAATLFVIDAGHTDFFSEKSDAHGVFRF